MLNPDNDNELQYLDLESVKSFTDKELEQLLDQYFSFLSSSTNLSEPLASQQQQPEEKSQPPQAKKSRPERYPLTEAVKTWTGILDDKAVCYKGIEDDHWLFKIKYKDTFQTLLGGIYRQSQKNKNKGKLDGIFDLGKDILIIFKEGLPDGFIKYMNKKVKLEPSDEKAIRPYAVIRLHMEEISRKFLKFFNKRRKKTSAIRKQHLDQIATYYSEGYQSKKLNEHAVSPNPNPAHYTWRSIANLLESPRKKLMTIQVSMTAEEPVTIQESVVTEGPMTKKRKCDKDNIVDLTEEPKEELSLRRK